MMHVRRLVVVVAELLLLFLLVVDDDVVLVNGFSFSSSQQQQQQQVNVRVERYLPNDTTAFLRTTASPRSQQTVVKEAKEQWIKFVWEKGGGLPLLGILPRKSSEEKSSSSDSQATTTTTTTFSKRMLIPIGMEEQLIFSNDDESSSQPENEEVVVVVKYRVTNGGLLSNEIVPNSHLGIVTFVEEETTKDDEEGGKKKILLRWDVTFDTTESSRTSFWQAVTERTITDTCNNFVAFLTTPQLYQRTTLLKIMSSSKGNNNNNNNNNNNHSPSSTKMLIDKWIQFCWKEGGGFPLLIPPIITTKDTRWIVPPFLKERLVSTSSGKEQEQEEKSIGQIEYQVENPGQFVYQVYSHRGRVQFFPLALAETADTSTTEQQDTNDDDNNTSKSSSSSPPVVAVVWQMKWQVEIRPYPEPWETIVKTFTAAVISCYCRNFKCHMEEEGQEAKMVALKPPRGGITGGSNSDNTLLQIRKDSWLGGVLDSHLKDKRNTVEQTIALLQPWTWGRTAQDDEEGEGEQWTKGYLSSSSSSTLSADLN